MLEYLDIYPNLTDVKILSDGFRNGFNINYSGPRVETECNNLISATEHEAEMAEKIEKEISAGRIAGPFDSKPFPNLRLSPIGVVPKKEGGWRMIQHLSYPQGESVNSFIDPDLATVQYTSFDKVLATISSLGKGAVLARMDIKSAYRLLPLNPDDFCLFGFKFKSKFYFDKNLAMGLSASCALWEKFATFIEWVVRYISGKNSVEHFVDDFLLVGRPNSDECTVLMKTFRDVCSNFGVPVAEDKTIGPSPVIVFLGLEISTIDMVISIPRDKLEGVKLKLHLVLGKKKITLRELQSLVGSLNFCARAIPSARAFNRRFCDAMCGIEKPGHFIRVSVEMKEDILMWLSFLDKFNGTNSFGTINWVSNADIKLFTDSSGNPELGCGLYLSGRWSFFQWPPEWSDIDIMLDITFLELVPIVLAMFIFGGELSNKQILFYCDNKPLCSILNKKTSKSSRVMRLIRPFVLYTMLHNIQFKCIHIEGRLNRISDSISRKVFWKLKQLDPNIEEEPLPVPREFLELISEMK